MRVTDFKNLDPAIQFSTLIAMFIRNEMEDFHCKHLSDEQMKELNPIIRQAVYNMLRYYDLARHKKNITEQKVAEEVIAFHVSSIPDYWEPPTEAAFRKTLLEESVAVNGNQLIKRRVTN